MHGYTKAQNNKGFTIVELLIVIVVIAILAAIVIVAYNGITRQAREASLKSDLQGAATQLGIDNATSGGYPATASQVNGGQGLTASPGNTLSYALKPFGYCIAANNPEVANSFVIRSSTNQIAEGGCASNISTVSGTGIAGNTDGSATVAQFNWPDHIAVDSSGYLYVADQGNDSIRKVSPSGVVSTLAGSGAAGYAEGTGTAAQFNNPYGVAVDSNGNVYVADSTNNRIRKITPAGVTSTYAGSGTYGYVDGAAATAQFKNPLGVAVDAAGNVYVADSYRVRKISTSGIVSTLAGSGVSGYADGTGTAAQFKSAKGIAVDSMGNVYLSDQGNIRIRAITPAGVVTTLAGSGVSGYTDGTGTAAQFNNPDQIAVDSAGNIYVADEYNYRIRLISPAGVVTTLGGMGSGYVNGTDTTAKFGAVRGVAVDSSWNVYVIDTGNQRVRKIVP